MTTSAASSRFETYTKEQLLYFYGIVNILLIYVYNIATVGWQLVHYTVYRTKKSDNGLGFASSIIAFLVDSLPSNICIVFGPVLQDKGMSAVLCSTWLLLLITSRQSRYNLGLGFP